MELVNLVKFYRIKQGLSQQQLADKCGLSRNTISSIETYKYYPTAYNSARICLALHVTFAECFRLVEGVEDYGN